MKRTLIAAVAALLLAFTGCLLPSPASAVNLPATMADTLETSEDIIFTTGEDTTFFYEGEDSDEVVIVRSDSPDFDIPLGESWTINTKHLHKIITSPFAGWLITALAFLIPLAIFLFFTAPLWILIILLIVVLRARKSKDGAAG